MKPSDFQKTIQCQFDCKLKRVVKGIVRNYRKELKRRRNKEISYCELPEIVVEKLAVWDEYESDYTAFDVCGIEVRVLDDDLAEAIKYLSEKDREILLMYFFLGMSDTEIGDRLKINKELSRVNAEAMQKLKEKDILKIFPTQKPHCTTRLVLKTPKTETSNRVVWLPKTVAELLVQYKKDQQELKEFLGSAYNDYNLVIALDNGNPVESRIVRDRFQRLCEENDYEVVVFHSLRHLSTGYKLKMTNGDVKSVQGDTGHAEAEMVTDVYSEIIDEDRRFNAQKMDKEFYSTLNDDTNNPTQDTAVTDSDMALLELIKSLSPEMKEQFLKQALQR